MVTVCLACLSLFWPKEPSSPPPPPDHFHWEAALSPFPTMCYLVTNPVPCFTGLGGWQVSRYWHTLKLGEKKALSSLRVAQLGYGKLGSAWDHTSAKGRRDVVTGKRCHGNRGESKWYLGSPWIWSQPWPHLVHARTSRSWTSVTFNWNSPNWSTLTHISQR